jgi:hypothetical protein
MEIDPVLLIAFLLFYVFVRCSLKPEKFPPGVAIKIFLLKKVFLKLISCAKIFLANND